MERNITPIKIHTSPFIEQESYEQTSLRLELLMNLIFVHSLKY